MRNLANFLLFQIAWFVAVEGAAHGAIWAGPAAMAVVVAVHLALVPDRTRELRFLVLTGFAGTVADTVLANLGATGYPSSHSAWPTWIVPPWITALWIGFATLPRFSLAWLVQRPWLAALLGAVGGPLSYLAGVRLGAVAVGDQPFWTWGALAAEYALATPLLLRHVRNGGRGAASTPAFRTNTHEGWLGPVPGATSVPVGRALETSRTSRTASMRSVTKILLVLIVAVGGALAAGSCSSMNKTEVESHLLALEKNRPVREAGLHVRVTEATLAGRRTKVEYRWHQAGTSGPVVVLVHGTPSSLVTWSDVVHGGPGYEGLARSCRVYALDVLGHGTTRTEVSPCSFQACADWVGGFLDMLDLRDVTLAGQSYGGEFAWRCALDRPERVSRLVLMSSSGFPRRDDEWLPEEVQMREMRLARFGWLLNTRDRLRPAVDLHFAAPSPPERIEEYFVVCENASNWRAMIDLARDENGTRSGELARLEQPTLLLWGERDVAYRPERFGRLFADTIPGARLVPVPGAGHYPQEEQPAFVARALAEFAREGVQ